MDFYCLFVSRGKLLKKCLTFLVASILLTGSNIGISYLTSVYISAAKATVIDLNKGESYSETDSDVAKKNGELHLIETTPSGRTYIWKMQSKWDVQNLYLVMVFEMFLIIIPQYFSKYEIQNSLIGGNFHNILITIFCKFWNIRTHFFHTHNRLCKFTFYNLFSCD